MVKIFVFMTCLFLLAACGKNEPAPSNDEPETQDEENQSDTEAQSEENTSDNEESPETTDILKKSFEAMAGLTSLRLKADLNIKEVMDGKDLYEKRMVETELLLEEPYSKHFTIDIESDDADPTHSEVYEVEATHYIHSTVHDFGWGYIPNPSGTQRLSPHITDDTLENHLLHSGQFEVSEEDLTYLLTFSGTYEEFQESMFGGVIEILQTIIRDTPPNMEDVMNAYTVTIDKDTAPSPWMTTINITTLSSL